MSNFFNPIKATTFEDPIAFRKYSLYKRKWKITVVPRSSFEGSDESGVLYDESDALVLSDSDYGEGALHCTFSVASAITTPLYGNVKVWNLSQKTRDVLVKQGGRVIVEAGYQNGAFGKIWNGNIFHFIEYRENVTDKILILHCIQPYFLFKDCFVMGHITQPENTLNGQYGAITRQLFIDAKSDPEALTKVTDKSPRPATYFGTAPSLLDDIAAQTDGGKVGIVDGSQESQITICNPNVEISLDKELEITPESGLLETPTNIPQGVSFKCLLDPRLKHTFPNQQIRIVNSETRMSPQRYVGKLPMFSNDGRYRVISVAHVGDTRGNDWFSQCEAWVNPQQLLQQGIPQVR